MKDIGYYAGFLSHAAQEEITKASLPQLLELLGDVEADAYHNLMPECDYEPLEHLGFEDASPRDKLALIRGLCDRIELKLMEAAK